MNDICLIIPYFGKLPAWMPLFVKSCLSNPTVDFLIITDDYTFSDPDAQNIKVVRMAFSQMQELLKSKLGKNARLPRPYKLCDYRPCFGVIFDQYLSSYEYWGHCDIDTILGDIRGTVDKLDYKKYDRLFTHGHFVLYKNVRGDGEFYSLPIPKSLPPCMNFDYVVKTAYPCHYDEVGINLICSYHEKRFCKVEVAYDVSFFYEDFRRSGIPQNVKCLVTYEDGHIYGYEYDGKTLSKKEYMYVHFMKRRIGIQGNISSRFIISHRGFLPLDGEVTPELINQIVAQLAMRDNAPIEKMRKNPIRKLWDVFKLDFPVRGFMAFHTIYAIWKSVRWINQEGGDDLYKKSAWFNGTITASRSN